MSGRSPLVRWWSGFVVLLLAALCSCQAEEKRAAGAKQTATQQVSSPQGGKPMKTIKVTSPAFEEGSRIPKKYTGEGADVSPALAWSDVPEGTKQFALICDDPDAPRKEPWVHWVIYRIPADAKGLPEGVERTARPKQPAGAAQGVNSWPKGENMGYRGPMPPPGKPHRYFFKLYALDQALDAEPGLAKEELLAKISGHALAEGQLMGTYERK